MQDLKILKFKEFGLLENESQLTEQEIVSKFFQQSTKNEFETLGIQFELQGGDTNKSVLKASHWVGIVWIEEGELAVRVEPKRGHFVEVRMLEECLRFPQIADRLLGRAGIEAEKGETAFFFWPEQKPIRVKKEIANTAYLFLIAKFLHELKKLCERHLKRQFPRMEENLAGKVKGRILIKENLRRNLTRGRPDRVYCQFQTHSLDTKENQILKAALEVAIAYLSWRGLNLKALWTMGQFCRNALAEVSSKRIFPHDFSGLRLTGIMKHYKKPIELAKVILQKIASEPNTSKFEQEKVDVFPYAIDMNQLFERYCEALLRNEGIKENNFTVKPEPDTLWAGTENLTAGEVTVRPDFLFIEKEKPIVADAKYKYGWNPKDHREDVYQVIAYTLHKKVQEKLGNICNKKKVQPHKIYIFYPENPENKNQENKNSIKSFQNLTQDQPKEIEIIPIPIQLPVNNEK